MNSQPSSFSTRAIVFVGGGAPATTIRTRSASGDLAVPGPGGVEHRCRPRPAQRTCRVTPCLLDPAQDLGAVDLAQHDLRGAHAGHRERHAPAVGVEHRQRVEVDVAVGDAVCRPNVVGVDPDVAVGDLHALGPRRRAAGVVDGRGRVLVRLPRLRAPRPRRRTGRRRRRARTCARPRCRSARPSSSGSTNSTRAPQCSTM